jgi:hypothetical protein
LSYLELSEDSSSLLIRSLTYQNQRAVVVVVVVVVGIVVVVEEDTVVAAVDFVAAEEGTALVGAEVAVAG